MTWTSQWLWRPGPQGVGHKALNQLELLGLADGKEHMMRKHRVVRNSVLT